MRDVRKHIILNFLRDNIEFKKMRKGRRFLRTAAFEANGYPFYFTITLAYYNENDIFEKLCNITDYFFGLAQKNIIEDSVYEFMKERELTN